MKKMRGGFLCSKCGNIISLNTEIQFKEVKKGKSINSVFIVDRDQEEYLKISQTCPKCGNGEAFRWFSRISGEHAGVRIERTVEHFKCTKCLHPWTKSS
jgi:DNA-directed RNA polymerase subunit M/transcription elongation factor TFIIS